MADASNTRIYFASDFHLGIDAKTTSLEREKCIVRWLDMIKADATEIYLLGDVFDYWFEYKNAIPKGFNRLLGKLMELRDLNIPIYFFTGNHDMWMFKYFETHFNIPIYRNPIVKELNGKTFFLGHGDGLGPGDHGYKFIKKVFSNKLCQWLFARIHPNLGLGIMKFWSKKSRHSKGPDAAFLGGDKEWLVMFANETLDKQLIDYFIFGHRHIPIDYTLKNGSSRYINLGEWLNFNSYAVFDGDNIQIKFFENEPIDYHKS
ncbi:MAG: UDP-2,3-diacylglucosamine diphosphatase [Bacteroidota bacterium]